MNFTLCCKPAGILQQVYCVYVMFPLIFNLHRFAKKENKSRQIVWLQSRNNLINVGLDCVCLYVFYCVCVCTRHRSGLLSLLNVILAVGKMGGMKRNIAY